MRDVRGGDVQSYHRRCGVHELPGERSVSSDKLGAEQLQVSCRLHGGCGKRGGLRVVRGGDVQECHRIRGVLCVRCRQVRVSARL